MKRIIFDSVNFDKVLNCRVFLFILYNYYIRMIPFRKEYGNG